jgi:hypothetical protein
MNPTPHTDRHRHRVTTHNERGITLHSYATALPCTRAAAVAAARTMYPHADRIFADPIIEPTSPYCSRCGSLRSACGGESDPHE